MLNFSWNAEKNALLTKERHISFERVVYHIEKDKPLDIIRHPDPSKYPNQRVFIVEIENYAYLVPFVENGEDIFLKTIIPGRKATKIYLEVKMSIKLSKEEKEILDSYENDEWVSLSTPSRLGKYKEAARNTFKKNKRVNIRISEIDLELLHEKALIEGLPYQTLMSSILHKYVTGRLTDTNT